MLESDHNHGRRHECVKQRGVGNKVFVLYLRNSVLKKIPYISLIRDPLTKTLTIQTEKNCSALALYRKLETIKGSVISAFRMGFFFKNIILPVFVAPPQFCISIVFNFPQWDLQSPQENLKTTSMQNVKGTTKSIMEFLKKAF